VKAESRVSWFGDSRRSTIRIPTPSGDELDAWVYQPEGRGPHPAVVMAHGLGAIKTSGLAPFAERFCREGLVAIVFDYRQWGGSTGEPRDVLSVPRQREDYGTVIAWAETNPIVDAKRIFAWGTSFAGMHIVALAASDRRLAGAVAQCPLVDGLAGAALVPPIRSLQLMGVALLDTIGSAFGCAPRYLPISVAPGAWGVTSSADALYGKNLIQPKESAEWQNRLAARSLLSICAHRPVRHAAAIRCPILLVVAEHDTLAPVGPALRVAARASRAELYRNRGGHYDVYLGGKDYDNVLRVEVEFLRRHAALAP
jgi:dienelactone hydrolase